MSTRTPTNPLASGSPSARSSSPRLAPRELPWSLALSVATHVAAIAFIAWTYKKTRIVRPAPITMTARFLLAPEEPDPAPLATPPQTPQAPAPTPVITPPEPPAPPPAPVTLPEPVLPPSAPITTTAPRARTAPVAAASPRPRAASPTGPAAPAAATSGTGGASSSARPRYASNPPPQYPPEAKRLKQQGEVILRVKVGADGRVQDVSIRRSSGFTSLDQAALAAVRRWRFDPARASGVAISSEVEVPVRFQMKT